MARADAKLERAVLAFVVGHPEGVTQQAVEEALVVDFPKLTLQGTVDVLNKLLVDKKVAVFSRADKSLVFKLAGVQDAKTKGLNSEELLVYQVIKSAGNTGVWTKDLKLRTNLGQPQINKIIKALENRTLIKAVKNVNNPSKKLYMLAELEPSTEITGGAWYSHQQLDLEFIEQLTGACNELIKRREPTLREITDTINRSGVTRVRLGEEDIQKIVNTLLADGKVESLTTEAGDERFRPAVLAVPARTAFTAIPCGVCPVMDQCREGGQVSPQTCVYYQKWLEDL